MNPTSRLGLFLGAPRMGKTYAAMEWSRAWQRREPLPLLVVDSVGAQNFANEHHATTGDLAELLWGKARAIGQVVYWHPRSAKEVEVVFGMLADRDFGRCHVMLDESACWIDAHKGRSSNIVRLARSGRHYFATLGMTTQYAGADYPRPVWSSSPEAFVFRNIDPLALAFLEARFNVPAAKILALPPRQFFRFSS